MSLRHACNNMDDAVDMLLRMQGEGTYENLLTSLCAATAGASTSSFGSASAVVAEAVEQFKQAKTDEDVNAMEVCALYEQRFPVS